LKCAFQHDNDRSGRPGGSAREDNGCGILGGVLRHPAFNLKQPAAVEKRNHIRKD
jgi:hypothetical protein